MESIGEQIKRKRLELGWSQSRLALAVGTIQPKISYIENGRLPAEPGLLRRLGEAVGLDPLIFIRYAEDLCDDVEKAITNSNLSQDKQELILMVYGHFTKRPSVENGRLLQLLALSQKAESDELQDESDELQDIV